jgi:chromosome segregation ATPase
MSSAAPLPSTPGGQTQGDGGNGNIKDSIAALRSILMIDTPTKSLLSSTDNPSIAAQQSRYDARKQQWEEIASLRNTTSVLKHRVQEVTNEASLETRKRKTLQTAYDALAKHKKELSVQLELVTKSREASEEKLANMRKALGEERGAMAQERVAWRPEMDRLSRDKTKFENKCQELEARSVAADIKVQELQQKVNRLEKGLSDTKAQLEENQTVQTALLPRAEQSEKARRKAEESLAQVQTELNTIKGRHHKSLTSMLDMQQKSKQELKEAQEGKQIAEERHQQALQNLKEAKTAEKNAIDAMQKATAEAQDLNFLNTIETKQKVGCALTGRIGQTLIIERKTNFFLLASPDSTFDEATGRVGGS